MAKSGATVPVGTIPAEHKGLLGLEHFLQRCKPLCLAFGVGGDEFLGPGV